MAANKKPGNPWNQFPKKKAPGKLSNRTPKPTVTPSRAVGAGGPPAGPSRSGGGSTKRGGALVKAAGNGNTVSAQVNPVKVRDVTGQSRGQVSGTTNSGLIKAAKPAAQPASAPAAKPKLDASTTARGRAILYPTVPTNTFLPNSNRVGTNLPSQAANALRKPRTSSSGSNGGGNTKPTAKPSGNFKAPNVPPAGSATKPPVKGTPQAEQWLKDQLKGKSGNIGKPTLRGVASTGASVALSGLAAAADYKAARDRGETRGRSAAQAGAGFAGALGGARAGAMLPGGPIVRGAGALLGGSLGYAGALKGMQGIQQASKDAENKGKPTDRDPKPGSYGPPTPKNNLASSVKGRSVGQQAVRNGKPVAWDGYKWTPSKSVGQGSVAKAPSAPKLPAASSTASRSSSSSGSGSSSSSGSTRPSIRAAASAPKKPQPGQSKDMNENYRTWAAANPTLAAKVKQGQSGYNAFSKDAVAGTGPVRDSKEYKPSVASKPSEVSKPSTTDIAYNKETNLVDRKKKKGQP